MVGRLNVEMAGCRNGGMSEWWDGGMAGFRNGCCHPNIIPIGLNWTILFKCLEMTIVVIWRYINKTKLN